MQYGMLYLRNQLAMRRLRIQKRYNYYEMKNGVAYFHTIIPKEFMYMSEVLGWCGKAVDSLGDRLCFREFENDNFYFNEIFRMNNRDVLFDSSILSALIASCSFVYISPDIDGFPRLQVIDGGDATGISDPITGLLTEGYAVISRKENKEPDIEAYFLPYATEYYQNGRMFRRDFHKSPYPLLVPIVFRPDAKRPFGHSRISRACMSIQQGALRTLLRSEVSAEFYSFPQRYVTGLANDSDDGDPFEVWKATMSSFIAFTKDEDGGSPHLGQFSQQSMTPYTEQLRTFAALFAAETGLTLDDLGFVTDNPSSAEAIKAAHENLRLIARKAQRTFGSGFLNVGYLAACVRDNFPYKREQFYLTAPVWEPVFEPDAAMLSSIGDGVGKINQAVPGYFNADNLSVLTGVKHG